MKVLKYSIDPKVWKMEINCDHCQSRLEINVEDFSYAGESGDYKDPGWERYSVDCGACGDEIEINGKKLPHIIKSYIQNKANE